MVLIMDDDDIALPYRLEKQVGLMEAGNVGATFGVIEWVDSSVKSLGLFPGAVVKGVGCCVIKLAETECFSAYRDVLTCADKSTADTLRITCAELIALF
jgi:hypothetical protein